MLESFQNGNKAQADHNIHSKLVLGILMNWCTCFLIRDKWQIWTRMTRRWRKKSLNCGPTLWWWDMTAHYSSRRFRISFGRLWQVKIYRTIFGIQWGTLWPFYHEFMRQKCCLTWSSHCSLLLYQFKGRRTHFFYFTEFIFAANFGPYLHINKQFTVDDYFTDEFTNETAGWSTVLCISFSMWANNSELHQNENKIVFISILPIKPRNQ